MLEGGQPWRFGVNRNKSVSLKKLKFPGFNAWNRNIQARSTDLVKEQQVNTLVDGDRSMLKVTENFTDIV